MIASLVTLALVSTSTVYADGRDHRNLLVKKLVNRELPAQIGDHEHRVGRALGPLSFASNLLISTQIPLYDGPPTPFHGFFVADTYLALKVVDWLDVNLNVIVLNQTASAGFRLLSDVRPGVTAHLHLDLFDLLDEPVRYDLLSVDLDLVTIAEGLLIETLPLEGFITGFRWSGFEVRAMFAGRVFWQQDDLLHFTATALDGRLGLGYTRWFSGYSSNDDSLLSPPANGDYVTVHGRIEPLAGTTLAGEYTARVAGPLAKIVHGALIRADHLQTFAKSVIHVGYQFRYYQTGFGPLDVLSTPNTLPTSPLREDYYVTNSFEYLGLSPFYDQWSHTFMAEARHRAGRFELFASGELFIRFLSDERGEPARPSSLADRRLVPGRLVDVYYDAGVRLYPFEGMPHRVAVYLSNKAVASASRIVIPTPVRFVHEPLLLFEAEIKL